MNTLSIRSIIAKSVVGCTVLLFLLSLAVLPTRTVFAASTASLDCGSWSIVPSPGASSDYNTLYSVAAVSVSNVWAVGNYTDPNSGVEQTLTEQWNGMSWSVISSPDSGTSNNNLNSVAAVSASNIWAVGVYQTSSGSLQSLIEHWNGTTWNVVSSPNIGSASFLASVTAVSAKNVWAVGDYTDSSGNAQTLTEHWNGTKWKVVSSPNAGPGANILASVVAVSAKNIWAVGTYNPSPGIEQTLTEQWNGKQWSVVSSPNAGSTINYLNGVTRVPGSTALWAVGDYYTGAHYEPLVEQWNGTSWSIVPSASSGSDDNYLFSLAAVSATDIWAVGDYYDPGSGNQLTLIEQWNGTSWNVVSGPNVGSSSNNLFAVATVPGSSDLWTVGYYQMSDGTVQTLTAFYC